MLAKKQKNCVSHKLLGEYKITQPLWKILWKFLKELNMHLHYDLEIHSGAFIPEKQKFMFAQKSICSCS